MKSDFNYNKSDLLIYTAPRLNSQYNPAAGRGLKADSK